MGIRRNIYRHDAEFAYQAMTDFIDEGVGSWYSYSSNLERELGVKVNEFGDCFLEEGEGSVRDSRE